MSKHHRSENRFEPIRQVQTERNFLAAVVEATSALMVVLDAQGRILRLNRSAEEYAGQPYMDVIGHVFWDLFPPAAGTDCPWSCPGTAAEEESGQNRLAEWIGNDRRARSIHWTATALPDLAGKREFIICSGLDITAWQQAEAGREKLIGELREALARIKTLSGLLPMCAGCKKIRDDGGFWRQVEEYIEAHSEVEFSHGLCPDCIRRLYPEFAARNGRK